MSKILKRPMFRKGGPAMSGIMSGIKPRQKYAEAGDVESYREEFMDAYGSVPRGGAFDPLTQLLIGFGQQAMTKPSSGNVLTDLVEASKDPSKQFFKAKSKEAADKRNVKLAATKFGLTEAGKDKRLQKRIDATLAGKESPEDKLKTNLTSEFFATYDDLGKAKNRAEFEVDIKKCGNVSQDGYTTLCGHFYHKNCLARWFNTSGKSECPMCRSDIKYDRGCVAYWPDGSVKRIQNARSDVGFYQNGKKKYKLALEAHNEVLGIMAKVIANNPGQISELSRRSVLYRARAFQTKGDILVEDGKLEEALGNYKTALKIFESQTDKNLVKITEGFSKNQLQSI